MADMLNRVKADVHCCACRGPIGERINIVELDRLATWPYPSAGNLLTGETGRAVAYACDTCIEAGRPIEEAVEWTGDRFVYHAVTDLQPAPAPKPKPAPIHFAETLILADNRCWTFCVGRVGERWWGFAASRDGATFMNVFPEVAENCELGILDKSRAIKLTTAIAQDPEQGLGEVERWFIDEAERGNPEDFRCEHCNRVACDGSECANDLDMEVP